VFFQALLEEEQRHAAELVTWIQELEQPPGEQPRRRNRA
jgi:hypothetical protein